MKILNDYRFWVGTAVGVWFVLGLFVTGKLFGWALAEEEFQLSPQISGCERLIIYYRKPVFGSRYVSTVRCAEESDFATP